MQAHILDLKLLSKLTQNPDTLRVLSEAITTARVQARHEARKNRRAIRDQALQTRRQASADLRRKHRRCQWRNLNDMRVESQTAIMLGQGVGTQATRENYLRTHWLWQPQHPNVSSTVV